MSTQQALAVQMFHLQISPLQLGQTLEPLHSFWIGDVIQKHSWTRYPCGVVGVCGGCVCVCGGGGGGGGVQAT